MKISDLLLAFKFQKFLLRMFKMLNIELRNLPVAFKLELCINHPKDSDEFENW